MNFGRDRGWGQPDNGAGSRARGVDRDPIADRIRASGHARRVDRPDTCLHPTEQPSAPYFPCAAGAVHT
jgi:hypothetical protein